MWQCMDKIVIFIRQGKLCHRNMILELNLSKLQCMRRSRGGVGGGGPDPALKEWGGG